MHTNWLIASSALQNLLGRQKQKVQMIHDTAVVATECEYETVFKLSNGTIFKDPDWPLTEISRSHIIQCQTTRKLYKTELYLHRQSHSKSYMIYQTAPFSMNLNDP